MENTIPSSPQPSSSFNWEQLGAFIASVTEQMKETDRQIKETSQQMKETDRRMKETDRRMKETDRQMKETDRRMKETDLQMKETDRRLKKAERLIQKSRKEFKEQMKSYRKETKCRIEENNRRIQEIDRQMQETDRRLQETDQLIKGNALRQERMETEMRKQIKEVTTRFLSQSGHIVEGLMEPSALNLFKDLDFDIVGCWKEMKATNKTTNRRMEVDLFYHDTTEAIAVEVKIKCEKEDIDHFLEQMTHFKEVFPKYADTNVYAAIAAINYNRGADVYAAEKGLFVIRVSENDVFSLDPANKADRIYF